MELLEKKIVAGSNVLVLTDESTWVIGRALGKSEELQHAIRNHDNEVIPAKQKVVQVYQYDVLKPDAANDPLKHTYCLRTNQCRCVQQQVVRLWREQRRERRGGMLQAAHPNLSAWLAARARQFCLVHTTHLCTTYCKDTLQQQRRWQ
jgi:hypothetical protein